MKSLNTNELINAMDGKDVALVLDTSMTSQHLSQIQTTVQRWKAAASTMGNVEEGADVPLSYQHASKVSRGILQIGNTPYYIFDNDCYLGENGLLFTVKIVTYYCGGCATHNANIKVFKRKIAE